jgi:hypothetical protein
MQLGNPSKKRALKIHDRQGSGGSYEKRVGLFFRRGFPRFGQKIQDVFLEAMKNPEHIEKMER